MSSISRQIAEFAVALKFSDLPHEVVAEAKRYLFDSIGCALGGSRTHDCNMATDVVHEMGGTPEASIFASGEKTSAFNAAFLNSLMIRALDYNDIYWKQDPSHPSDIIPAALAVGEKTGKSGQDLMVGIVLAYEFEQRLCECAFPGIRERKWHHATLTQFVSPIVAGKMFDLNVDQMVNAIGIGGSHNLTMGAVTAGKLTMMKNTVDPLATRSGVLAAHLASKGYEGTETIFEGKEGLFETLGPDWKPEILTDGLGESYRILRCSMKAFPTEALTHAPIGATLSLVKEHDISPDEVEKVKVRAIARAADILADPSKYHPDTRETADHSLPYCLAAAIADRKVTPEQFSSEKLTDPVIRALLPKISVMADPEFEKLFPEKQANEVTIETTRGKAFTKRVDYPKGDPRDPMTPEELTEKFDALASPLLSDAALARLKEGIWRAEKISSIGELMRLTVADR